LCVRVLNYFVINILYSHNIVSVHVMKAYGLRGGTDPASHKFGTRGRRVVITHPGPQYPRLCGMKFRLD
jgi:hypothetical protein